MIYFAQSPDGGPVKIGCTTNLATRIKALETHYGCSLAVLTTMEGGRDEERAVHERFSHLRIGRTEQFRPASDLMEFIGRPLLVGANPDAVAAMPGGDTRAIILSMKMTAEFHRWLKGLAEQERVSVVQLLDLALVHYAKHMKFTRPAPKRTEGR